MTIFTPDTSSFPTFFEKASFLLAWRISLAFIFIFSIVTTLYSFSGIDNAIPSAIVLLIGLFCFIFLYITRNYIPIFWVYSISGFFMSHFAMNTVMNLTHYVDFMWIMITLFMTFIGLGQRIGIIATVINAFLIAYFFFNNLNRHIVLIKPRTNSQLVGEFIEVTFALFVLGYLIHLYYLHQQHSNNELKLANSELEKQNQLISTKNNENIVLLKEVHHRVKNNLQIITSLLRLQKGSLPDEIKLKFDEAISRIMTMSLIHSKLYQTNKLNKIEIESYINDLIFEIIHTLDHNKKVSTEIKSDIGDVGLKTIVRLGLLLNELLSNSFKHAFKNCTEGNILIHLNRSNPKEFILIYSDSGKWKEQNTNGFGLELIETLTEQLEGSYTRNDSTYHFQLNNLED